MRTDNEIVEKVLKDMNIPVIPCEDGEKGCVYIDGVPAEEWFAKHPNCFSKDTELLKEYPYTCGNCDHFYYSKTFDGGSCWGNIDKAVKRNFSDEICEKFKPNEDI